MIRINLSPQPAARLDLTPQPLGIVNLPEFPGVVTADFWTLNGDWMTLNGGRMTI